MSQVALRNRFVAVVRGREAHSLIEPGRIEPLATEHAEGTVVLARSSGRGVSVLRVLAEPRTALADAHGIAASLGFDVAFPDEVIAELDRWRDDPGIADPVLVDRTALPFVTIDSAGARDLDQAIFVEAAKDGFVVHYAIADAAYYAPRNSALWREALRRGATFYLPGLSVPMLPRSLSEGLVSLGPDEDRRALVFEMSIDASGHGTGTVLTRARIRSRAKLSWSDVQRLHDGESPLVGSETEASLRRLGEVGRARLEVAKERDVVRYHRNEVEVKIGSGGDRFVALDGVRNEVELWNEQISLLCNAEGARLLKESASPAVQPIYRVHPAPDPARIADLRAAIDTIVRAHRLDPREWSWDEGRESLAVYLSKLPDGGPHARVARAISRQAILVNVRSTYSSIPSVHFGAGFDPYARFSAPMREVVGVYLHGEVAQMRAGERPADDEVSVREAVIDAANRSKDVQRRINDVVNRRVIDRLFEPELALPLERRGSFPGTVVGIGGGKLHVTLDQPAIDVKVYLFDAGRAWKSWLVPDEHGVVLRDRDRDVIKAIAGDRIEVRVVGRDAERDRWVLEPQVAR